MLILPGSVALSEFRRQKLLETLQRHVPAVRVVRADYCHFARCERDLTDSEHDQLKQILTYGEEHGSSDNSGTLFLVIPRPGTISPWSTKATDIAHNCGLSAVSVLSVVLLTV